MSSSYPAFLPIISIAIAGAIAYTVFTRSNKPEPEPAVEESPLTAEQIETIRRNAEVAVAAGQVTDQAEIDQDEDTELVDNRQDDDERARRALEDAQRDQQPQRQNRWKTRGEVGTKKAKSLAKREQRRAYFEYVAQRAAEDRERQRIEQEMFGDLIAEEQADREARIAQARQVLEERNASRRQQEEESRKMLLEIKKDLVDSLNRTGKAQLHDELELKLAQEIPDAIIVDDGKWAVAVNEDIVDRIASALSKNDGLVSYEDIQSVLT